MDHKIVNLFLVFFSWVSSVSAQLAFNPAQYVNPFIGTGGHGHTFPGATVPFGMVQLSPDTRIDGSWDGCSGYHYSDTIIYGFSHTHLSGTGVSDYGDIAVLPYTGSETIFSKDFSYKKIGQTFTHKNEEASAGFYRVKTNNGTTIELTATPRCGFHRYTFSPNQQRMLIIKIEHRDRSIESSVSVSADRRKIIGYRESEAWARNQHISFVMEFSEEFELVTPLAKPICNRGHEDKLLNPNSYLVVKFKKRKKSTTLQIKTGISFVNNAGAEKNLLAEIPHWDFEKTKAEAQALWNKELGKIEVTSADKNKLTTFYSALYHCMIHPSIANDVDGNYRGRDNQVHHADHDYYTVFSLWDTYRALHPLLTIIDKKRTNDFIKTFLLQYQQGGRLPVWELSSNETDCMIGYHSVSVITDAYVKGIQNFDVNLALEAMQKSANWNHLGLPAFNKKGYCEIDDEHESVSKSLEYGYDNWCIATLADAVGRKETSREFFDRSLAWRNLFDPQSKFIRPRANGGWLQPFNPTEVNNHYTEANGWQYNFYVPHDLNNLVLATGGEKKFGEKLDSLFYGSTKTTGRTQADITGLIGQYAHGNEPSHHMAYLYTYAAQPWKTQELVHKICNEFYKNEPDGLIGNEDCGQMSAWYVFSMLGFYPLCPGSPEYVYGTPGFEKSVIHLENGKNFTITAKGFNQTTKYLKDVDYFFLKHENIATGGQMVVEMSREPQTYVIPVHGYRVPKFSVESKRVLPAPVIHSRAKVFRDTMKVSISSTGYRFVNIEYKSWPTDDTTAARKAEWKRYEKPFTINASTTVVAVAYGVEKASMNISSTAKAVYHKIPHDWSVQIHSKYNPQYTAGGAEGLIDGLRGDENWRKGYWQGYQAQDFECIIDLKEERFVTEVGAGFLQDSRSWILYPTQAEFYVSADGKNYTSIGNTLNKVDAMDENVQKQELSIQWSFAMKVRYVKVIARNFGKLPAGHQGHGMNGDAFIFVDEVWVK